MKKIYRISKNKALKILGLQDFSEMQEDRVGQFVSLARQMDPEVVKAAIDQFPEFKDLAIQMTANLKEMLNTTLEYNNHSQDTFYDACKSVLSSLDEQLKDEEIDSEERAMIRDNMLQVLKMMSDKDSENKKHIQKIATWFGGGCAIAAAVIWAIITGDKTDNCSSTVEIDGDGQFTDVDYMEIKTDGIDSDSSESV